MAVNQKAVKVLNKVLEAGFTDEKAISAMTMDDILSMQGNLQDYFSQLKGFTRDSFLEELDDFNVEVCYRRLVTNSVAFMLMSRCGLDTSKPDNSMFDGSRSTPSLWDKIPCETSKDLSSMMFCMIVESVMGKSSGRL